MMKERLLESDTSMYQAELHMNSMQPLWFLQREGKSVKIMRMVKHSFHSISAEMPNETFLGLVLVQIGTAY
jgi:hypothetical protein